MNWNQKEREVKGYSDRAEGKYRESEKQFVGMNELLDRTMKMTICKDFPKGEGGKRKAK